MKMMTVRLLFTADPED